VSTGFICAISGVILGRKRPKYNKTLRATATTPTTSTTVGLLSYCSNLLTYLGTALLWPCRRTKDNANSEAPFGSAVVAARTSQNAQHTNFGEIPKGEVRRILILDTSVNKTFVRDAPGVLRWHHGGRRKGFGPVGQGLKKEEEGIVCPPTWS
jgi:hypothetical protein